MASLVPLAEMEGVGAAYAKICADSDVGEVEIFPLPPELKLYACMVSLTPAQYRFPFQ